MNKSPFGNLKIALDTNILSYLLDNTYANLTLFIQQLNSYPFVEIECSKFVIYELIGIRKLEHYLRKINEKSIENGKIVNFSSALNYRKKWNAPELEYKECYRDVKADVEQDLARLTTEFDIQLSDGYLHRNIWRPHQDLVLSSKISKEDSMVLISSAFPDIDQSEDYLIFLTNDHDFYGGYCGKETQTKENGENADFDIDSIFATYSIKKPIAENLNSIKTPVTNKSLNIVKGENTDEEIKDFISLFLFEHFQEKNSNNYLGKISKNGCGTNNYMLCFKMEEKELSEEIYLSILTKDLEIINVPNKITSFWAAGKKILSYPYTPDGSANSENISVQLKDQQGAPFISKDLYDEIMVNGNLVFLHPDSFIS